MGDLVRLFWAAFPWVLIRQVDKTQGKIDQKRPPNSPRFFHFESLRVYTEADSICKKVGDLGWLFWAIFPWVLIRQVDKTQGKIDQKRPPNAPRFLQIEPASVYTHNDSK